MSRDNDSTFAVEQAKAVHWQDLAEEAKQIRWDLNLKELPESVVMGIPLEPVIKRLPVRISESFLARNLLLHLKVEFPELPWGKLQEGANVPREILAALQLVAARRTFRGACEICEGWDKEPGSDGPPLRLTMEVVGEFLNSKRSDLTEGSRVKYQGSFKTFAKEHPYLPVTPEPIEDYLSKRPAQSSKRYIYAILSGLYEFAHDRRGIPSVMERIRRPPKGKSKESDYLPLEQLKILHGAINDGRLKGMAELMVGQGFRRSEVHRANVGDVFEDKIRVHGKEAEEWMPLLPEIRDSLLKQADGRTGSDPLFVSKTTGKRLGVEQINKLVTRLFNQAGINGVRPSPHTLRHSFCTLMQANGCDRYSAELLMRHRTPNTTDIYTHITPEQRLQLLRPKLEQFSPIRLLNGRKPAITGNNR